MKARLVNYFDVWGNKKDGWEINNLCTEAEIEFPADRVTNKDILKALKECGFLAKHVRLNMLNMDWTGPEWLEIEHKANGYKPVCRLEFID